MNKKNQILVGVFFLQILILLGMRLGGSEDAVSKPMKVFENLDAAKVTRIKILGEPKDAEDPKSPPQASVELAKDGTQWGIATAEGYPADNTKVEEFLSKLGKLTSRGPVLTKSTYHKKVEVADDKYQRKITLTMDGKDLTFYLGTSPGLKNVHLRKAGSDDVVQASEITAWEAGTRAWDWVDRAYVKFADKDVWGVTVQNKNGTLRFAKSADGTWSVEGAPGPTKKSVIDDLVKKASTINLEEPIGKNEKPEQGLSEPLATVTLQTGTSSVAGKMPTEMKTDVVRIGKKSDTENRYFAKATTSAYVVQVAGWAVEPLVNKGMSDLLETEKKDAKPADTKKDAKPAEKKAAPKKK